MNVNLINFVFALGTIAMQLLIIKLVIFIIFREKIEKILKPDSTIAKALQWSADHTLHVAFILALGGTLGSLFYSIGLEWIPCELCWYQRIFLYPQVIIIGLAIWKKNLSVRLYSMWLSVIGALIAGYQVLLQFHPESIISECGVADTSCATINMLQFGYITFPVMSLTIFVLIFLLAYIHKK